VDRSKKSDLRLSRLAICSAIAGILLLPALSAAAPIQSPQIARPSLSPLGPTLAQDDDSIPDEDAVPTDQVDKYIAVYSSMQKNHSLSVEQAASKQGLTVEEFRTLEDKIERNPIVHERVLDALKASASGAKTSTSGSDKPK